MCNICKRKRQPYAHDKLTEQNYLDNKSTNRFKTAINGYRFIKVETEFKRQKEM